ncbi:hypothetical protein [Streptomyces sp. UNOC14_S4]|uniref:primase 1D-like protein n=1 Tax=Streptomyces sp. UNOC14_S4 TaxID=2872340 RepID=UPI001E28E3B9|nr:hypothetical protein [Streptomyces sp. UNOC14_S4]MCC3771744.1 hypothetical protein [Streptomyces sp. UNOC14_S4]
MDALRTLVMDELGVPSEFFFEFAIHEVGVNWRQRNVTARQRIESLPESLLHGPFESFFVKVGDRESAAKLYRAAGECRLALSVASRIRDEDMGLLGHLALMNLHPEGFLGREELGKAVLQVTGGIPGYLLTSGRFFHYYGRRLLSKAEWTDFAARFLMPCTMVSPRYIGHSLSRDTCCLRLNAVPPHKPSVPEVVAALGAG